MPQLLDYERTGSEDADVQKAKQNRKIFTICLGALAFTAPVLGVMPLAGLFASTMVWKIQKWRDDRMFGKDHNEDEREYKIASSFRRYAIAFALGTAVSVGMNLKTPNGTFDGAIFNFKLQESISTGVKHVAHHFHHEQRL